MRHLTELRQAEAASTVSKAYQDNGCWFPQKNIRQVSQALDRSVSSFYDGTSLGSETFDFLNKERTKLCRTVASNKLSRGKSHRTDRRTLTLILILSLENPDLANKEWF
jgi:hypothetical protein